MPNKLQSRFKLIIETCNVSFLQKTCASIFSFSYKLAFGMRFDSNTHATGGSYLSSKRYSGRVKLLRVLLSL